MRTVVKIALINNENKVLLNLRDRDHPENPHVWAFLGGGVDKGETEEEALLREVKEEIDYELKEYKKIKEVFLEKIGKRIFYVGKIDKEINELTLREGEEIKFFNYEETKEIKINKLHLEVLKKIYEK
ncbi:NUDIX domain-containing protein [Candidatus Woesearchaeota archaeon]|jgi:8-oxo-dGTP diphosphatase|nr:NUDIX domain-containing protein [Candidatus Woesearchaeota archaeon]MBT4111069.1 NUDIX domain-containing protein [Candidatus Woesearchaeota archaeon]MBT4336938.1 NUDIX domain-containing protein [Candidatus Woesearchaeota archaeon]MBT4469747.1 NUDIX domain-containing protein [Candidatus Woesearchaeota archaeon]MBT6743782.1 NUDIX domain-containing protein [Candidatus Woesearchaeota archaeon]